MPYTTGKKAFTVVELVMVIAIVGILAAVAVPVFVNFSKNAKKTSDDTVLSNLSAAIQIKYAYNLVKGIKNSGGSYYPEDNPFDLFSEAPPHGPVDGDWGADIWRTNKSATYWYISCPHYKNGPEQGRIWTYFFAGPDAGLIGINWNNQDNP